MKSNVEALEENKVKLTVELSDQDLESAIDAAYKKLGHQVSIPGFRRGKAPRRITEKFISAEYARAQALQDSIPDFYMQALHENDVDAIEPGKIEIKSGEEDGPVVFESEISTRPVPQIPGYESLQVTIDNPIPTDEQIDAQIERLQKQHGELEEVDREAKEGDFLILDIEGLDSESNPVPGLNTADYSYEIGAALQSLGPDFDGQVTGTKAGDERRFTSQVPPNDLEVNFTVKIKVVNQRNLPDLNDEFANEVSEFETLEELRENIASRMKQYRLESASEQVRNKTIEALADLVDEEVPEILVDNEMKRQLRNLQMNLQSQGADISQLLGLYGQSENDFVDSLKEGANNTVRADLALRSLAEKQNIEVSDDEVDNEVEKIARQIGQKTSRVRRDLERTEQIPAVRSDIRKTKALEWLLKNVQIVDFDGEQIDRSVLGLDETDEN